MKFKVKVLEVGDICRGSDGRMRPGARLEMVPMGLQLGGEFILPLCISEASALGAYLYSEVMITIEATTRSGSMPAKDTP